MKLYKEKSWLKHKYCEQKLSTSTIGKLCGVSKQAISHWLKKLEIKTRPAGKWQRTDKSKRNLSLARKGMKFSEEHKRNIGNSKKGMKHSIETRKTMSESRRGKNHPMFGKKHSEETRRKMSLLMKGKIGNKSPRWKGDKAGYRAKHIWITTHFGHAKRCEFNPNHVAKIYHWANISGKYTRNLIDYVQLCPRCHQKFDRNL